MNDYEAEVVLNGMADGTVEAMDLRMMVDEGFENWVLNAPTPAAREIRNYRGPAVGYWVRLTSELVNEPTSFIVVETSLPVGTEGVITRVGPDIVGESQIGVRWNNGSTLMLLHPRDTGKWEIL